MAELPAQATRRTARFMLLTPFLPSDWHLCFSIAAAELGVNANLSGHVTTAGSGRGALPLQ